MFLSHHYLMTFIYSYVSTSCIDLHGPSTEAKKVCVSDHPTNSGSYRKKQGKSVARDLPPTGSEANTTKTHFFIKMLEIA